jgi:hypothetical protein
MRGRKRAGRLSESLICVGGVDEALHSRDAAIDELSGLSYVN